jgi:type II secretory pathway component PulK
MRSQVRQLSYAATASAGARDRGRESFTTSFAAGQANNPWRDPAQLIESGLTVSDLQFTLDVRDGGAALNINTATEQMLRQFLGQGIGLDYPTADRITQAMLDWRDEDELPRTNSGERQDYIDAGAAVLPANRRFADVDELRHVMGMTPELLEQIRPFVTVIGSGRINVNAATVEVLCALPGYRPAHWAQLVRLRDAGQFAANTAQLRRMLGVSGTQPANQQQEFDRRVSFTTTEVVIVSEGRIENSPVRARATTVVAQTPAGAGVTWQKIE